MSERYRNRRFPGELHAIGLKNVDVRVWSRLRSMNDREAAKELIEMQFPGEDIRLEMRSSVMTINKVRQHTITRGQAAEKVFQGYLR